MDDVERRLGLHTPLSSPVMAPTLSHCPSTAIMQRLLRVLTAGNDGNHPETMTELTGDSRNDVCDSDNNDNGRPHHHHHAVPLPLTARFSLAASLLQSTPLLSAPLLHAMARELLPWTLRVASGAVAGTGSGGAEEGAHLYTLACSSSRWSPGAEGAGGAGRAEGGEDAEGELPAATMPSPPTAVARSGSLALAAACGRLASLDIPGAADAGGECMAQLYLAGVLSVHVLMGGGWRATCAGSCAKSVRSCMGGGEAGMDSSWTDLVVADAPVSATCCMPLTAVILCLLFSCVCSTHPVGQFSG